MEFEIWLSRDQSGVQEKVIRENTNPIAAVIEFSAFYKALGYKYILIGLKHDPEKHGFNCMPWSIFYGRWDEDEIFNIS